ncbi:hypothetical protein [Agromyces lapidis]|uniref:Uncharacterized protein n=1 Tax=Agromyces lapidis TaxID=279574 RepID=A0ABV5SNJ9_9MICO|nr:hypothetical protein [Agromyces lapidis]
MSGHDSGPGGQGAAEPASLHLSAELRPRRLRGIRRAVHTVLLVAGEAMSLGGPSVAELVVVRTGTGAPVIRTGAGSLMEADELLRQIRADLDRMSVEEFLAEWGHLKA